MFLYLEEFVYLMITQTGQADIGETMRILKKSVGTNQGLYAEAKPHTDLPVQKGLSSSASICVMVARHP